jgi:hypothetical protein
MNTLLPAQVDRSQAFRYMGMHTAPDAAFLALADICEKQLLSAVSPACVHRVYALEHREEGILCTGSRLLLTGQDITSHLRGCSRAVLFCATLSLGADREIRRACADDVLKGMMTDAMASALTEQVCDLAEAEILKALPESYATWRFSPGYGDLPLDIQGDFLAAVNAEKRLGVCVSESGLLTPRKSVTAIIGLSDTPVSRGRRGCAICSMSRTCPYRAKGAHCK